VVSLAQETKKHGLVVQKAEIEALAARMEAKDLDLGFVAFCADRAAHGKNVKNPRALLKRTLFAFDDAAEEYKAARPPIPEPTYPEPESCTKCGGDLMRWAGQKADERLCARCRAEYHYDPALGWNERHEGDTIPEPEYEETG
jgi:hypothetical protein